MSGRIEPVASPWQRVSGRYVVVDLVGNFVSGVFFVGVSLVPALLTGIAVLYLIPAAFAITSIITLALVPRRVRSIGYQLRDDDLVFRRGLLFQRFVSVPYGRMQLVDIKRGPIARAVGLSELRFVTAAAATGVTIPGLPAADAESLRDRLVALAETRRAGL